MTSLVNSLPSPKARSADLPDFRKPPLIEVVLGVQFAELGGYRTVHAGLLWEAGFRSKFPKFSERPILGSVFETFGAPEPVQTRLQVEPALGPVVPRIWFVNEDETELIQFQANRFLHNWTRNQGENEYPRYEPIRLKFFEEVAVLDQFFEKEEIGVIEPNQCEVSYINHIQLEDGSDPRSQFDRIFAHWSTFREQDKSGGALPKIEGADFNARFVISDPKSEEPRGRLYVKTELALSRTDDPKPVIRLNLTARGAPTSPTLQGVADFLDMGREAIVRGFAALTTPEMHKIWERIK